MTDNNADETDGQGINLSRRGAVALLGTSAVGGTVATGAFSQLIADRPINVEVVDSDAATDAADSGNSELQVINNSGKTIDATIETANSSVLFIEQTGSSSASVSGSNPSWSLTGLESTETAQIKFNFDDETTADVDFDVTAFAGTGGFGINTTRTVNVAAGFPTTNLEHDYDPTAISASDGDSVSTLTDQYGSIDLDDNDGYNSPIYRNSGINNTPSLEFYNNSNDTLLQNSTENSWLSGDQAYTVAQVINLDSYGSVSWEHVPSSLGVLNTDEMDRPVVAFAIEGSSTTNTRLYGGNMSFDGAPPTSPSVIVYRYDGSGGVRDVFIDNSSLNTSDSGDNHDFQGGTMTIGSSPPDESVSGDSARIQDSNDIWFEGDIGRTIVYSGEVGDTGVDQISKTLASQYGITL